eukprot:scaffold25736_cov117-Cylindrotheca_fusiformis.AAC.6
MKFLTSFLLLCEHRRVSHSRPFLPHRMSSESIRNDEATRVCFNHAGASPSPLPVIDRAVEHMQLEQSIGGYAAAQDAEEEVREVYQAVAKLINARSTDEIALVESATVAWTRLFYSMAQRQLKRFDDSGVILICEAEYAANAVAVSRWAEENKWTVLAIPSASTSDGGNTGMVDLSILESMMLGCYEYRKSGESILLDPSRIAMVCITHIPTNSGILNPVEDIGRRISKFNSERGGLSVPQALYLVDACQSVGHVSVDVQEVFCHGLVATGRKYLRGPRGTGFLFVSSSIVDDLWPQHIDHYGVPIAAVPEHYRDGDAVESILDYRPRKGAKRFEFWEANVANRLALGVAIRESIRIGPKYIENECFQLAKIMRDRLIRIPNLVIHHSSSTRCGIVTFYTSAIDSQSVYAEMQKQGFELSVVPATSTPIDSAKSGVPDLVRASVSYFNSPREIECFVESLSIFLEA